MSKLGTRSKPAIVVIFCLNVKTWIEVDKRYSSKV